MGAQPRNLWGKKGIRVLIKTSEFLKAYCSGKPYELSHVVSEVKELLEEIRDLNPGGIVEEWDDSAMTAQLWLHCATGWDWSMWVSERTLRKCNKRMRVWALIFRLHGLEFSPRYLCKGANYRRESKRDAALWAAWQEQKGSCSID